MLSRITFGISDWGVAAALIVFGVAGVILVLR